MSLEAKLAAPVVQLNVCCGRHVLDKWINIDVTPSAHKKAQGRVPDVLADMRQIPLPDGCADELMCIHGIEHVLPWEADVALKEWLRLLKPGGRLVLELPDLAKCCENLLSGYMVRDKHPDQMGLWGIYGDSTLGDPHMMHRYGYTPQSMREKLHANGYVEISDARPEWHAAGAVRRDMRLTATKPR
jgi:SAM-dependent methyltransferase